MNLNIIYSAQEYSKEYEVLKSQYFSRFKEVEELDFINTEIENYNLYNKIVKLPIDKAFNRWCQIDLGIDLKTLSLNQELKDFVMENHEVYCKIYYDIVGKYHLINIENVGKNHLPNIEIAQLRLSFPKISSFLYNKKSEIEKPKINIESYPEIDLIEETEINLPYKIAILKELGFFELEKIKKLNKENMYKIVCKNTGGNIRSVKGNILVLNSIGKEDREKYTSNNYLNEVGLMLSKLIK